MIQILGLNGSVRASSSNARLLDAAKALTPKGANMAIARPLDALPHFNPDQTEAALASHAALISFVDQVRTCNALVVSAPVYASGYPGVLKNALDWLVGTDAFVDKPFLLLNASDRVPGMAESLATVLHTMSGQQVANVSVNLLGSDASRDDILANSTHRAVIEAALAKIVATLNA